MQKLAQKLANKISKELNFDDEKTQVIAYGLLAIIQYIVFLTFIVILGLIFGIALECLTFFFAASLLRRFSGGVHVSRIGLCTSISVILCVMFSAICKYFLVSLVNINVIIICSVFVYLIAFWGIYKLAPVDSPNKPIKTDKKKKRLRKNSYITLLTFFAISVVFLLLSIKYAMFYSLCLCLLLGILWQISTLTKTFANSFKMLDFILK